MAIEKLKLLSIIGPIAQLDNVIEHSFFGHEFHPETAGDYVKAKHFSTFNEASPYSAPLNAVAELIERAGSPLPEDVGDRGLSLEDINSHLEADNAAIDALRVRHDQLALQLDEDEQIINQVTPLLGVGVPLEQIFTLEYLRFRFGRLSRDSYQKLQTSADTSLFVFLASSIQKEYVWGMYFAPKRYIEKVDSIFAALHFERVRISDRAHGTPVEVRDFLMNKRTGLTQQLTELVDAIAKTMDDALERWMDYYRHLKFHADLFACRRWCVHTAHNFYLVGWVPEEQASDFEQRLNAFEGVSCVFENPGEDPILSDAPTKLKNLSVFQPFEQFVDMYGLPKYGEIDPTPLVAITYSLLFGLMFGDVGQGAVLFLAGLLLWKFKKMGFGRIIATCGLCAMGGGFLFGSVFGYEGWLPGFRPMEDTTAFNIALMASVGIGAVLLIVSIVLNIINGLRHKNYENGVFGPSGIMGLVFYVAVLVAVVLLLGFGKSVLTLPYILIFCVIPLLGMFLREPLGKFVAKRKDYMPESKGEFILENFFEMFEVILSFITNTISFVRIGAFALNHAGMMMFVYILARMAGSAGNIAVLILGNLLVIGLEGLIVGIQVLRLQYYEIFSHFFSGEGRAFTTADAIIKK